MRNLGWHGKYVSNTRPHGVEMEGFGSIMKRFLVKNCMKCTDLDREIMFLILHPLGRSGGS